MESNRVEAIRAKNIAEEKMENNDFNGARRFALKAQRLYPELEKITQMLNVCDVHCSAEEPVVSGMMNWYKILQIEVTADDSTIKKQYKKFALRLHPDKNKFAGAETAFKLIGEAQNALLDNEKRFQLDMFLQAMNQHSRQPSQQQQQSSQPSQEGKNGNGTTFWTKCRRCYMLFEDMELLNKTLRCKNCGMSSVADEADREGTTPATDSSQQASGAQTSAESKGKRGRKRVAESMNRLEFNDFNKYKKKGSFGVGQIWALYDTTDGMPRFYALITGILSPEFKLQIKWLEPNPTNLDEVQWLNEGLPIACGKHNYGETEIIEDLHVFSHLVFGLKNASGTYKVYPRKGEIWALFKNWDIKWYMDAESHRRYDFEFVEILSDYVEGVGVVVAYLDRLKDFVSLFSRMEGDNNKFQISSAELFRFSHKVPSFKMTGKERVGVPVGSYELDPKTSPMKES